MTIKTLKTKLIPGAQLRNTDRLFHPELIGSIVTVNHAVPAGIQFQRGRDTFFMPWPKPSRLKGSGDGFIVLDDGGRVLVAYEFLPPLTAAQTSPA